MKEEYIIQMVPVGSTRIISYRIRKIWVKLFSWLVCVVAALLCVFIWKFQEINVQLASSWKLKADNEQLLKRQSEYELAFSKLDSIYVIEIQIQNILSAYLGDDSTKIRSILDRNDLAKIYSKKSLDTDYENEISINRQNLDIFPNMLPIIGSISRHYSEDHKAVDFVAATDEPVYATASGKVIFAGDKGDYGVTVEIDHNGITTRYAHLSRHSVRRGGNVKKGEIIGFMGNTGNSSGPHLHYEMIFNGNPVNPEKYF